LAGLDKIQVLLIKTAGRLKKGFLDQTFSKTVHLTENVRLVIKIRHNAAVKYATTTKHLIMSNVKAL
jgi:hypothetical protein